MFTPAPWVATFNHTLSLLTLLGALFLIVWLFIFIVSNKNSRENTVLSFISKHSLPLGFLLTFSSLALSLFYSEYIGYLPCALCWFQRIFLYPLAFMFGVAWYKKDFGIFRYVLTLSIPGAIIAAYHSYIQMGYREFLPCPATGMFADCAKPSFIEFGFVTFPFMSLVLFAFLILLSVTVRSFRNRN